MSERRTNLNVMLTATYLHRLITFANIVKHIESNTKSERLKHKSTICQFDVFLNMGRECARKYI